MHKPKTSVFLAALLLLALAGCGSPSGEGRPPQEPSQSQSQSSSTSSGPAQGSSSQAPAPEEDWRRYPGSYYTAFSDYSHMHIEDSDGQDITPIAIDLWYAANEVYNVGDTLMFRQGIPGWSDVRFEEYPFPEAHELLNYQEEVEGIFTPAGIAQLEQTWTGSSPLIRRQGEKVYRMASWKTGDRFAETLLDMQVQKREGETITLAVTCARAGFDNTIYGESTYPFTIAKVDGRWLVEDYLYPGADSCLTDGGLPEMSYEEYFAQEIALTPQLRSSQWGDLMVYYPNSLETQVMGPDGEPQEGLPYGVQGQLYRRTQSTMDGEYYFPTFTLLLEGPVTAYDPLEEAAFCAVGNRLYRVNYLDRWQRLLTKVEEPITQLAATENLIYFVAGGQLYRHYLPAGVTDRLCQAPTLERAPVPLSNHRVYWRVSDGGDVNSPDFKERIFFYDDREGAVREVSWEEARQLGVR